MKFVLEIELGNDAMTNALDVADALNDIATDLYYGHYQEDKPITDYEDGDRILDVNGNIVGSYKVVED